MSTYEPRHSPLALPPGDEEQDALSLAEYLTILLDEWKTLLFPIVLAALLCVGFLLTRVPTYRAGGVTQVSMNDSSGAGAFLEFIDIGTPSPVETEVEILSSSRIVGAAIQKLNLNVVQDAPSFSFDLAVTLDGAAPTRPELIALRRALYNVEAADSLNAPLPLTLKKRSDGKVEISQRDTQNPPVIVKPGERYSQGGVSFELEGNLSALPLRPIEFDLLPLDMAIFELSKQLSVSKIGRGRQDTNLVRVSFEHPDRSIAKEFINAIMDSYLEFALEWQSIRADRTASFIDAQIEKLRSSLESSEHEMQAFVEQNGAIMLPEQAMELIRSGAELELEQRKTRIREDLLTVVSSSLRRSIRQGTSAHLTGDFLIDDPLLTAAVGKLSELEMDREVLLADVTESHPQVEKIDREIERIRAQIDDLVAAAKKRIRKRDEAIDTALASMQEELASFPDKERQLAGLQRRVEVGQQLHTFLLKKLEESRIAKAATTTDKRIIDYATTPFRAETPRRKTTALLFLFLGLLVGVAAVFLRRTLDPRIRDEEEVKGQVELATYGAIPDLKLLGLTKGEERSLDSIWASAKGPSAEAFRTLRTNVEFAQVGDDRIQVLQITSSEASEGKSTVLANLGVALSKAGHKTLLVDLDLRRPSQHRIWSLPRSPGISDHLVGQAELNRHNVERYGIDVITAGHEPPESQRLLASQRLGDLIEKWRGQYDYVLLDTPPLLVTDSLVISRNSDLVLFVVRPRVCRRTHLRLAQSTASKMNVTKGLVINGIATRRGGYYHYYRGSYYGSKSTDTQEN